MHGSRILGFSRLARDDLHLRGRTAPATMRRSVHLHGSARREMASSCAPPADLIHRFTHRLPYAGQPITGLTSG
ncbi:hypothetical protein GUJ93_ZPchr0004g38724 [Zizania palustris]|uniref:Uncharacterized protein n=1 Tax=Zizania palustris TaxID=103762 RepID=A0A8J5STB2_ZIZPA|nr:hypothetical protein GUJ93_ZPchr0004g38724 [Zizania palustris]